MQQNIDTILHTCIEPLSSPTGAHIINIHNGSYSATVELLWDISGSLNSELEGIGNITYAISVSSNGETWMSRAAREDRKRAITLSYNTNYTLSILATNCAGDSEGFSVLDILIGIVTACNIILIMKA